MRGAPNQQTYAKRPPIAGRPSYRFAGRPKWILSHLFVLAMVVLMVNLGFWQLRRLDERKAHNRVVSVRTAAAPMPVDRLLGAGDGFGSAGLAKARGFEFRQVTATGTYRADQEVLVRGRSLNGAAGSWVLTPLQLADGTALVVNRGWIPNDGSKEKVPSTFAAPSGPVQVTGLLQATQTKGSFGATDPPNGTLTNLARADILRLQRQVPEKLVPAYAQLERQRPSPIADRAPTLLPGPELSEGPHLSYAIQWFLFSIMAVVVYAMILRRSVRERAREAERDGVPPDTPAMAEQPVS